MEEKEYKILRLEEIDEGYTDRWGIIRDSQVESTNLCETYNRYGQKIGCYDAGCYCIDSSEGNIHSDLKKAVKDKFDILLDIDVWMDTIDKILNLTNNKKIKQFISSWIEEETEHIWADSFDYFDGSNWQSIIINAEYLQDNVEELNDDIIDKILAEMPEVPYIEDIIKSIETENFIFTASRYASNPFMFTVSEKNSNDDDDDYWDYY